MESNVRKQLELLPGGEAQEPHIEPITPELVRSIRKRQTFLGAWNYAQDFAALQDKQVYGKLRIDASQWSKIRSGTASPPGDERFTRYFDVVKNEFPLVWLVEARGYDFMSLRKHRTSEQREIAELKDQLRDRDNLISLLLAKGTGR